MNLINCRKWPDMVAQQQAQAQQPLTMLDKKMMMVPAFSPEETERRLMKLQALEESGVGGWQGFPDAMDHYQDILRASEPVNLGDEMPPVSVPADPVPPHMVTTVPGSYKEDLLTVYAIEDVAQEECAEVIQAIAKIRRFGMKNHITQYDNKKHLTEEIGQLYAALDLLTEAYELDRDDIEVAGDAKMRAIHTWAPYYERNREDI